MHALLKMNHYHIYEAIGRGKNSTVYKGRNKKTNEYVAIKSFDKSHKSKILQEVRILRSLDHPNVLKFYSWYETSTHLWLVLEYCVGGDLMTLLRQDSQLHEASVHELARNLVRALQFLHSKGIIYCDLKPSNILLDENGRTKLCDFGLARKLSDISRTPSSMLPQAKRGTPCYMAPELFEDGGVHSYASDLWALGCVLYECYAGRPPFVGEEFTQLVKSILSDPTPPLPGNPSRPFVTLIHSLLIKDPAQRIEWTHLCGLAFWKTRLTPVPLPPQPAFDNMIELYAKPCLSEHNGDRFFQNKTLPKYHVKDAKGASTQNENSVLGARSRETPAKGTPSARRTQTNSSGRVVEEKQKDPSSATRLISRIAKANLQRENEKENYWRPLPNSSENDFEVNIATFDNMIELYAKPCLSERNGDRFFQNMTLPKYHVKNAKGASTQDENSILGARSQETPAKGTLSARRTQTKASGRVVGEKQKDPSSATSRVSRIAKTNLQRENEKENYRRPLPNSSENDFEVNIVNTDIELDFDENTGDEAHDEPDGSDNPPCTSECKLSSQNQHHKKVEAVDNNTHHSDTQPVSNMAASDDSRTDDQESSSEHVDMATTPLSICPQLKRQRIGEGSGSGLDSGSSKSSNNLSQVLWHPSDLSVRPVMPSRKADKVSVAIPSLPFEALEVSDFVKMSKEQLDLLNNRIVAILNGNTSIGEKQNVIRYLEMLSSNAEAANILTNGPIMLMLVKMVRRSKASALLVQLTSLIGLLIRHSTFIEDDLANSGILGSLTDGLRDKQDKVRRFTMAALGELLFYISSQNERTRDNNPPESLSKDNRSTSGWQVSNSVISLVSSVLRKGEDDMTQLYALRTIENVCSQGAHWAARFTSQDVISKLCYLYRAAGKQESIRLTAGSCLVRLVRFSPPSIQSVIENFSFKDIASALVKGSPREQQISLNLLNMAMLGSHMFTNIGQYLLPLVEAKNLVPSLLSLIEQGSEVLRGKALVFLALLCKNGRRWLPHIFCNARLLSAVDRLAKEKDTYVQQSLDAFVHIVASTVQGLLDSITGDIQQMMGGRRHVQISAFTSRAAPKTNVQMFSAVLNLLGSSSFKNRVVSQQVLQQLENLIREVETPFQSSSHTNNNPIRRRHVDQFSGGKRKASQSPERKTRSSSSPSPSPPPRRSSSARYRKKLSILYTKRGGLGRSCLSNKWRGRKIKLTYQSLGSNSDAAYYSSLLKKFWGCDGIIRELFTRYTSSRASVVVERVEDFAIWLE